jgi:hypothetical protein
MRSGARIGIIATCMAVGGGIPAGVVSGQGATSTQATAHVQRLSWMSGCWQRRNGTRLVEEQWMVPRGGVMMGMSRTVRGDTLVEYEQLRIYERPGRAMYSAAPSGQAPAEFEARATSDTLVVFENPAHDYPQRIIYRRRGNDSLLARIEGTMGGQARGTDFPFVRAACLSAPPPTAPDSPPSTADLLQASYDELSRRVSASNNATSWMVENSLPSFALVYWQTPSATVPVATRAAMVAALERAAAAPPPPPSTLRNNRYVPTVDQLLVRGDTADVLLIIRHTFTFADVSGALGEKGRDHDRRYIARRRDNWLKTSDGWRLARAEIVSDETYTDGKLTAKDGKPVK